LLNNIKSLENRDYAGLKEELTTLFNTVLEDNKKINIIEIDNLRKMAIAIKAFDLVSFSMSLFAYVNYKTNKLSYYKTLAVLNDAKYLAMSSSSYPAQKINNFFTGLIEFEEGNFDVSLELINRALNIIVSDEYDFNEKISEYEDKIKKLQQKKIISAEKPSFIPKNHGEDQLNKFG